MSYAGHLPTRHFDLAEWQAMPVWAPKDEGECPPDGWSRTIGRGNKPVVVYFAPVDSGKVSFAVRPIVRVKMGRKTSDGFAFEQWTRAVDADFMRSFPDRCEHCGSSGMQKYCSRCP